MPMESSIKKQFWTLYLVVATRKEVWGVFVYAIDMHNLWVSQNNLCDWWVQPTNWSGTILQGNTQLKNAIKFVWTTLGLPVYTIWYKENLILGINVFICNTLIVSSQLWAEPVSRWSESALIVAPHFPSEEDNQKVMDDDSGIWVWKEIQLHKNNIMTQTIITYLHK